MTHDDPLSFLDGQLFNQAGQPMSAEAWGRVLGMPVEYRRVARDEVGDVTVSTVWLGLDHGFGMEDAPLIFETLIFGGDHDGEMMRYPTRDEALAGHAQAVALVTAEVQE